MSLRRAKHANYLFKDTAFGFVREHERAESINAPAIVKYLILNYYLLTDKFTNNGKGIDIEDVETVAKCKRDSDTKSLAGLSVLGAIEVGYLDEGIQTYQWSLKIKGDAAIGIVSQQYYQDEIGLNNALVPRFGTVGLLKFIKSEYDNLLPSTLFGTVVDDQGHIVESCCFELPDISEEDMIQIRVDLKAHEVGWYIKDKCIWKIGKANGFKIGICRLLANLTDSHRTEITLKDFSIKQRLK